MSFLKPLLNTENIPVWNENIKQIFRVKQFCLRAYKCINMANKVKNEAYTFQLRYIAIFHFSKFRANVYWLHDTKRKVNQEI